MLWLAWWQILAGTAYCFCYQCIAMYVLHKLQEPRSVDVTVHLVAVNPGIKTCSEPRRIAYSN